MIKWKLIQKTPKKYLWWGFLVGIPGALWIVTNYMKAALASSILFGCMHFSWSILQILFNQNLSLASFMGNLNQVFYTFCFGMPAAGVTLYAGSIIPMVIWHSLIGISAEIYPGLMFYGTYTYHVNHNPLTLQNLFEKYGILSGVESGEFICKVIIDIIFLIAGIVLVRKAEKRMQNEERR